MEYVPRICPLIFASTSNLKERCFISSHTLSLLTRSSSNVHCLGCPLPIKALGRSYNLYPLFLMICVKVTSSAGLWLLSNCLQGCILSRCVVDFFVKFDFVVRFCQSWLVSEYMCICWVAASMHINSVCIFLVFTRFSHRLVNGLLGRLILRVLSKR